MTIIQVPCNTELRSLPFARKAGYSPYRSHMDSVGRVQNNSAFGDAQVSVRQHDISMNFYFGLFDDEILEIIDGGGTITVLDSILRLTATNAGDQVQLQTRNAIIYQAGFESQCMFSAQFTVFEGDAEVLQEIGVFDGVDGWTLSVDDGLLRGAYYSGGVIIGQGNQNEFNLDKLDGTGVSGFKINLDQLNYFRVQYSVGVMPTTFEIFGGAQLGWIPFFTVDNVVTGLNNSLIQNPHLPIRLRAQVISGTPSVPIVVSTAGLYGGSLGGERTRADSTSFAAGNTVNIPANGSETPLFALRNKLTFRGLVNQIRADIDLLSLTSDGNKSVFFNLYSSPVISGAIFEDVETLNSVIEVAQNDFTFTGGRYAGSILINKVDSTFVQFNVGEIRLNPDQTFVVTGTSDSGSEIRGSVRWGELR